MVGGAIAAAAEYSVPPVPHARRAVRHRRGHGGRRRAVDADPEVGGGHRGRGPRHASATTAAAGSCAATPSSTGRRVSARQPLGRNIITALWGNCTSQGDGRFPVPVPGVRGQVARRQRLGAAAHSRADRRGGGRRQLRRQLHRRAPEARPSGTAGGALRGRGHRGGAGHRTDRQSVGGGARHPVTSGGSAIAKASLDASLQDDLPEESRASAFGRSESLLQLAWVAGGAIGVLVYTDLWVGFTAITAVLILGLAQTIVSYRGDSLIPGFGGNRPVLAEQEGGRPDCGGGGAGVKRVVAVLAVVALVASIGHRRADLAADPRPATAAARDQRLLARAAGAGGAVSVLRRAQPHRLRNPADRGRTARRRHGSRSSCRCRPPSPRAPWVLAARPTRTRRRRRRVPARHQARGHHSRPSTRTGAGSPASQCSCRRWCATRRATSSPCRTPNGRCARCGASRAECPAGTRSPSRRRPGRRAVAEWPAAQRFPAVRRQPVGQLRPLGHDPASG